MIEEKIATKIRELSPITINRIAAGEVVERPAAVVKELVENALDAGSTEITIKIESGGQNLILISDNGSGMSKEDLVLAVQRHTTSKLLNDNLLNIKYFGFRGEALPSIASVSRMTVKTCLPGAEEGWMLNIVGGETQDLSPIPPYRGTIVEIRDLFFATPARLKFLRSEKVEIQHIIDITKKIAAANPKVKFSLFSDQKLIFDYQANNLVDPLHARIQQIFNKDFIENSIEVSKDYQDIKLHGYISLPTYNRGTANEYYTYVNGRPVKDKLLLATIRSAYQDFLSKDRYPVVVLFLDIPCELVDVNVHPSKTEVRFRDTQIIRTLVIHGLREALQHGGNRTSSTIAQQALISMKPELIPTKDFEFPANLPNPGYKNFTSSRSFTAPHIKHQNLNETMLKFNQPIVKDFDEIPEEKNYKLGAARCQLHETYIISQTPDSIIIIDQHAAHERLMYEKLKQQFTENNIAQQRLLIPEIIEVSGSILEKILSLKETLNTLGISINQCTNQSIIITEIPHLLGNCNVKKLVQDIIDEIEESEDITNIKELINHTLATYACHYSIRSGRKMNVDEMNQLLRQMESTPHSGQCNHGRPTYIELELKDIEKLFGRT